VHQAQGVSLPAVRTDAGALAYCLPRLPDVLFCALFIAALLDGPRLLNGDGDIARHLTVGEHILQTASIPTRDLFSHSMAGQPFTPHEWLAEVVFAASYRWLGLDGVVLLSAVILAAAVTLVYMQAHQRSGMIFVPLALAVWAAVSAHVHWLTRPHLWTMLMVVVWSGQLERLRRGASRAWWVLPIVMFLWTNLHGAFIAGFVIWITYGAGMLWERATGWRRAWVLGGVTALAASLANPSGWHVWATSLEFLRNRYLVDRTAEYMSPNFHSSSALPFLGLLALCLFAMGMRWLRLNKTSTLILTSWAAMSLISARNIPLFSLMAAPILAEGLSAGALRRQSFARRWLHTLDDRFTAVERSLRGHAWPGLMVGGAMLMFALGTRSDASARANRFDPTVFPVQAIDWIEANGVHGHGFNYFPWGGYLLHRLWPRQTVFIDGQTDFYGESLTRQYETVLTVADTWQDVLRQYDVQWVLMPARSELVHRLSETSGWRVAYTDRTAVLLVRHE